MSTEPLLLPDATSSVAAPPAGADTAVEARHLKIDRLEELMAKIGPVLHIEPRHYFSDGLYAREVTIPPGTLLTSKIHRTRHLVVVSRGEIVVFSADGSVRHVSAPATFVSEPGSRRVGIAGQESVVWTTVHATEETDVGRLEEMLYEVRASTRAVLEQLTAAEPQGELE